MSVLCNHKKTTKQTDTIKQWCSKTCCKWFRIRTTGLKWRVIWRHFWYRAHATAPYTITGHTSAM